MKTSRTIPVFKKEGSLRDRSIYRPINCFSNIFEKSVDVRIKHFLDSNKLFYSHQYGFRDGRNIQQAIIKTSNLISKVINNEKLVIGLFLDILKTFDSMDRNILIEKLENAGISGPILELMKSYLNDRIQRVFVNNTISDSCKVLIYIFHYKYVVKNLIPKNCLKLCIFLLFTLI